MPTNQLRKLRSNEEGRAQREEAEKHCEELGFALDNDKNIGKTVDNVQKLILRYYNDVRDQATLSFRSAKRMAISGFILLVVTVVYVIFMDLMRHIPASWFTDKQGGMNVGAVGLISGAVMEFIAGTQFLMHGRTARQFGAFHICLERTHRYLLAYKIAGQIKDDKDGTLEKIVCIMANAPMITRQDIEGANDRGLTLSRRSPTHEDDSKTMSAVAGESGQVQGPDRISQ